MGNRILVIAAILVALAGGGYYALQSRNLAQSLRKAEAALKVREADQGRIRNELAKLKGKENTELDRAKKIHAAALAGEKKKHDAALKREVEDRNQIKIKLNKSEADRARIQNELAKLKGKQNAEIERARKNHIAALAGEKKKHDVALGREVENRKQIKSKLNKIEVALTREREALKRIQKNQKEGEIALARESEALKRLRKKQKDGEAALARERSSASRHRADLDRLRAALEGTSSTAKESRQKLAAAKGMLTEMEESRRRVEERALRLSTKVQSETRRARKLERDVADLSRKLASQQITLRRTKTMLRIDIIDRILFDVGQARIKEEGLAALNRIAAFIKKYPGRATRVEGHTDNIPISGALSRRYPTNWELSAARAIRVVRHLQSMGVPPGRLSATARSFYRPVASNDSVAGRSKNRRIVILMSSPAPGK